MIKARRVKKILTSNNLEPGLLMSDDTEFVDYNFSIDLGIFLDRFNELRGNPDSKPEDYDAEFSKILYDALIGSGATEAEFYDMRFWQWISITQLLEYCIWRWGIDVNNTKKSHPAKVLGGGGVGGFSLNTISRLFIPAKILLSDQDGDSLLKSFFKIQQKEQSISQSTLAVNSDVFISIVKATANLNTKQTVKAISRLNARKASICIDAMNSEEISELALLNI